MEQIQQWEVYLGDRLEEPILLETLDKFRMADKRQVAVKDETNISIHR